jgi:hypothetical protein
MNAVLEKRKREIDEMFESVIGQFARKHPDWTTRQLAEEFCMGYNLMLRYLKATDTRRPRGPH